MSPSKISGNVSGAIPQADPSGTLPGILFESPPEIREEIP